MSTHSSPARRARRGGIAAILAAGSLIALAGCAQSVDPLATASTTTPDDYRLNHPITIADQVATLDVPVSADTKALTEGERANIAFFAQSFLASGTTIIAVVAPSGSPNQVAAASIAVQAEDVLRRTGINPGAIDYRVYRAGGDEKIAPVRLAFDRIAATTAPCGPWEDDVANTAANRHYEAFGCATQQNLAAVVDNPLDLLYPRGMSPADAARRAEVLEKYRSGTRFSSDTSGETGGTVATGVGSN
jgi:pilus assembly protein CpaD